MKFRKEKNLDVWIGRGYGAVVVIKLDDDGAYRSWSTLDVSFREQSFDSLDEAKRFYGCDDGRECAS